MHTRKAIIALIMATLAFAVSFATWSLFLPLTGGTHKQEPFSRVAPLLQVALLMGVCGGFLLATILTITSSLALPLGPWWEAMAQAHGHLQLYGWAGLFVLGVALHFLPRLRGAPLAGAHLLPWMLGIISASLVLRALSQPLQATGLNVLWSIGLVSSGVLELVFFVTLFILLIHTAMQGPRPTTRPAYWGIFPFLVGAFCSLGLASIVNLLNVVQAVSDGGLISNAGDALNVTLGLLGFLVPIALAMSARSLPMYAGLESFPRRLLWPLAATYIAGLVLMCIGTLGGSQPAQWAKSSSGLGMLLLGGTVLLFIGIFLRLISLRGRIPQRVAQLAPEPGTLTQTYQRQIKNEHANYGPFVGLVASAYLWAMLGSLLLLVDGVSLLATGNELLPFDAIRHSFALGFIALLICGVAPRMLPSFSGSKMVSPKLVSATLWLGNSATVLRVGALLLANTQMFKLDTFLFGLSGPCGLTLAICLAINLWPTLRPAPQAPV